MPNFDPRHYIRNRLSAAEREFVWTPGADESWKRQLLSRLVNIIGLPERTIGPVHSQTIETTAFHGYSRERVTFRSQLDLDVFAYLLIPDGIVEPRPAVVCIPGHGSGVEAIVDELNPDYQSAFAIKCVRSGFVTLAIEQIGFGHRKNSSETEREYSCQRDSMAALMLGETMIGWRVRDAISAIDYLQTRAEVDPTRVASMGISGGGLTAFWTACMDERVAASVVSGYFSYLADSILSIDHCVDNFAPGLAKYVEMPDMVSLIAPRNLFVESGTLDPIFPAESFVRACDRAREIYAAAEVASSFGCHLFEGDHRFCGDQAIAWLADQL